MTPLRNFSRALLLSSLIAPLFSTPTQAAEELIDQIAAVVNDDIIMKSELERRSAVIREQLRQRNTRLPAEEEFSRQVLDKMVNDQLQLQQAKQRGFRITDADLNRALERIADSNGMTLEQFRSELEAGGQDYREVREQIRDEMLISQTRERLINQRVQVTEQEVQNFLNSERGQQAREPELHLTHIMIPIQAPNTAANIAAARAQIEAVHAQLQTGADFAALAVAHSKGQTALDGGDLGWRNQSELPEQLAEAVEGLQPGEISQPFRLGAGFHLIKLLEKRGGNQQLVEQTKVRHILVQTNEIRDEQQAKELIDDLYQRIQNGESFAELARQFSDDTGSGSEGGELGWASPGQMVPAFEQTMNRTSAGELSAPFKSRFGWHILEVAERRQQDVGDTILANRARDSIRKRKFAEELDNWLRELRDQAYIEIKNG